MFALLLPALLLAVPVPASAGMIDEWLEDTRLLGGKHATSLSSAELARGLKEALEKGTQRTVRRVGRPDGYWKNARIRIPLPEAWRRPAQLLAGVGMGSYADELQRRMNRAAEAAAPLARPIFIDAIRQMRFADVRRIWKGPDDAATRYFQRKTGARLTKAFSPLVHRELQRSGAVRSWRTFSKRYEEMPLVGGYLKDDLDAYVTRMALAGLFSVLADEEARIRRDPAARTTELLRKLFR